MPFKTGVTPAPVKFCFAFHNSQNFTDLFKLMSNFPSLYSTSKYQKHLLLSYETCFHFLSLQPYLLVPAPTMLFYISSIFSASPSPVSFNGFCAFFGRLVGLQCLVCSLSIPSHRQSVISTRQRTNYKAHMAEIHSKKIRWWLKVQCRAHLTCTASPANIQLF